MASDRRCLFERLPREVQQMIFKEALTDCDSDIIFDANQSGENHSCLRVLETLSSVKLEIYQSALDYMGDILRIVITIDEEPHRTTLQAFRRQMPYEIRRSFKRVYLPKFTIVGLICPETWLPERKIGIGLINMPHRLIDSRTPYANKKLLEVGWNEELNEDIWYTMALRQDMRLGLQLLRNTFPSLQHLDLGVDLLECIPPSNFTLSGSLDNVRAQGPGLRPTSHVVEHLGSLATFPGIQAMCIRVFWDDFIERRKAFSTNIPLTDEIRIELQEYVIAALRHLIPAKSITGHSLSVG
ncbi:hypothetical protein BU26DRAFT_501689 [Trematosphaeria pertusa]|uniref:Uncharacterized protein n=1 Tax=Trematosphaeria pertusa TaxID=390896 RepID=A0A6A6ISP8_9PLEO|nr:uncharacterized protein BU26DRAFT_501689 [Trematosphaeria pertusa]KAF2253524.1 hypothetical protein BU26DRAFT_501689 [Trematosphaeria pertusa]